jgi:hypothetical protein
MDEQYALRALSRQLHRHFLETTVLDPPQVHERLKPPLRFASLQRSPLGQGLVRHPRSTQAKSLPPSFATLAQSLELSAMCRQPKSQDPTLLKLRAIVCHRRQHTLLAQHRYSYTAKAQP